MFVVTSFLSLSGISDSLHLEIQLNRKIKHATATELSGVKSEQRDVRLEERKINEIFKDKFNYNILQG